MTNKCWVYHPHEEAKIVNSDEAENLYENGWFDTPSKFAVKAEPTKDSKKELKKTGK